MPVAITWISVYSALSIVVHGLGILNAAHAVMNVRSSRSAIAWCISLITFPWVTIPLYWILGKSKFRGYSEAIHSAYSQYRELVDVAYQAVVTHRADMSADYPTLEKLAGVFEAFPFTQSNAIQLLIDGKETYRSMLDAIASATDYILLQSYIIHDDDISNRFKTALIEKARQGIRVYVLYDSIGSHSLSRSYIESLREQGIEVSSFRSTKGRRSRFQINFRNHRKILVVDGRVAFMGGLNIGDEYLGRDPKLGNWRDTHMRFQGPSVQCLQAVMLRDWYWATKELPDARWQIDHNPRFQQTSLILSTGPADRLEECMMFFLNIINQAQERLWIASPYFVPDDATLSALKLAALRGVDVRIILPSQPDHLIVYYCAFSFYAELQQVGIQLYRYQEGFMHQKVVLCDSAIAGVGTVNLDNRSFYLNFEVMSFVVDRVSTQTKTDADFTEAGFIRAVEEMLEADMVRSRLVDYEKYQQKPLWFKLAARASRLMAPIL